MKSTVALVRPRSSDLSFWESKGDDPGTPSRTVSLVYVDSHLVTRVTLPLPLRATRRETTFDFEVPGAGIEPRTLSNLRS